MYVLEIWFILCLPCDVFNWFEVAHNSIVFSYSWVEMVNLKRCQLICVVSGNTVQLYSLSCCEVLRKFLNTFDATYVVV
jgi:hypothetical protein